MPKLPSKTDNRTGDLCADVVHQWLTPDWSIPGVRGYVSTRYESGISCPPYNGFNTADHVGDDPDSVHACRQALQRYFQWPHPPQWLKQVHGTAVAEAGTEDIDLEADAVITTKPQHICTLHTADCLPVFFADQSGSMVALAHAGWRGLAAGILENVVSRMQQAQVPVERIIVWLGPAIGQAAFEVGPEVREAFLRNDSGAETAFIPNASGRWQADLYTLAKRRLQAAGVTAITGGQYCTWSDPRFFSYRRQAVTGRMVSLLWLEPN